MATNLHCSKLLPSLFALGNGLPNDKHFPIGSMNGPINQTKAALPFGGDMAKAMQARDRDAIRKIMTFKKEQRARVAAREAAAAENAADDEVAAEKKRGAELRTEFLAPPPKSRPTLLERLSSGEMSGGDKSEEDAAVWRRRQGATRSTNDAYDITAANLIPLSASGSALGTRCHDPSSTYGHLQNVKTIEGVRGS